MMGSVAMMYANHMISLEAIIISAFSGTLLEHAQTVGWAIFFQKKFVKRKTENTPR